MGMLKFEVSHQLPKEEARKRIEALLSYWSQKYGMKCQWTGDAAKVSGKAMGVSIDATLQVTERTVGGEASDPGFLLRGQATKYLKAKMADYLDPHKKPEELARA
ncbi:MAG: polyhydroxyalkanoic acid system family protein [Myxococcaceae bacterium]